MMLTRPSDLGDLPWTKNALQPVNLCTNTTTETMKFELDDDAVLKLSALGAAGFALHSYVAPANFQARCVAFPVLACSIMPMKS